MCGEFVASHAPQHGKKSVELLHCGSGEVCSKQYAVFFLQAVVLGSPSATGSAHMLALSAGVVAVAGWGWLE